MLFVTTSSRIKQSEFDEYSELIHTKGGKGIDTFFIKTLWKDNQEIQEEVKKILVENAGEWMERKEKK